MAADFALRADGRFKLPANSPGSGAIPTWLLTKLYADHLNANQGRIPARRGRVQGLHSPARSPATGKHRPRQIDSLFVSTRDNRPLVVVYKPPADPRQLAVVAYEQSAVDGKRSVGYRSGTAELIDEAAFPDLAPTAAAKYVVSAPTPIACHHGGSPNRTGHRPESARSKLSQSSKNSHPKLAMYTNSGILSQWPKRRGGNSSSARSTTLISDTLRSLVRARRSNLGKPRFAALIAASSQRGVSTCAIT